MKLLFCVQTKPSEKLPLLFGMTLSRRWDLEVGQSVYDVLLMLGHRIGWW